MSRIFSHYDRLGVLTLLFGLLAACASPETPPPPLTQPLRLTQGAFLDEAADFHPSQPKALILRQISGEGGRVTDAEGVLERQVIEVDFRNPTAPQERVVTPLSGGSQPSYAGDRGIVALDRAGMLVFLPAGGDTAEPLAITETPSRPSKPVASPDGHQVAFLAIPTPPPTVKGDRLVVEDPALFRYQAWVAPLEGGPARRVGEAASDGAMLTELRWDGPTALLLVYQVPDPRLALTRVERVSVTDGSTRLAFFADLPSRLSFPVGYRFFARPGTQQTLLFAPRAREREERLDFPGEVRSALLAPDGRVCLAGVWMDDREGVNLWLTPTPSSLLELPEVFGRE